MPSHPRTPTTNNISPRSRAVSKTQSFGDLKEPPRAHRALRNRRSVTSNLSQKSLDTVAKESPKLSTPPADPAQMAIGPRKAALHLDLIVVGAGIGGLAAAYALARSGHRVRIYEKRDGIHQRSVGVRVPPNLSKILYEWGLHDQIMATATGCRKSTFHSIKTNKPIGILEWQEDVIKETGGDFLLIHYDELYGMIHKLAVSEGVSFTFNSEVTSVSFDEDKGAPVALLANGSVLTADLIIGADGYHSVVREAVTGEPDNGQSSGQTYFTIIVPAEKLKDDPDWSKWVGVPEWPMWMGAQRSVLAYPISGGQEYCVHAYWPETHIRGPDVPESWATVSPTSVLDFEGCHESIKRIFSLVPDALRTKYVVREALDDWIDESGTMLLIGEAAHAFLPFTIHNCSLAVEDAAVLGVLLSHLRARDQIPQLLEAYQDLRHPRVKHVQQSELGNAGLVTLPDGEIQQMRDAAMSKSLEPSSRTWDDEQLRQQWEETGEAFGYYATDAAEDWWVKWGTLGDVARNLMAHQPMDFMFHVTKTAVASEI